MEYLKCTARAHNCICYYCIIHQMIQWNMVHEVWHPAVWHAKTAKLYKKNTTFPNCIKACNIQKNLGEKLWNQRWRPWNNCNNVDENKFYKCSKAIIKIYYHPHHCSHFMAATFDFTTFSPMPFEGCIFFMQVGSRTTERATCQGDHVWGVTVKGLIWQWNRYGISIITTESM